MLPEVSQPGGHNFGLTLVCHDHKSRYYKANVFRLFRNKHNWHLGLVSREVFMLCELVILHEIEHILCFVVRAAETAMQLLL